MSITKTNKNENIQHNIWQWQKYKQAFFPQFSPVKNFLYFLVTSLELKSKNVQQT